MGIVWVSFGYRLGIVWVSFGYHLGIIWVSFGYPVTKSVVLARPGIVWVSSENFLLNVFGVSFGYRIVTNLGFPGSARVRELQNRKL